MADSSFGRGWPYSNPNIVTLVRADGLRLPVHKELKELFRILLDLTEVSGYNVIPTQTWGYSNRPISGTNTPSNHSWGTAIDINAPSNPYASATWHRRNARGTKPFGLQLVCNIPEKVVRLWEGNKYNWGGRYGSHPDPMHFDFKGTVSTARTQTAALKQFLNSAPNYGLWPLNPNKPGIKQGSTGGAVKYLQQVIYYEAGGNIAMDGNFGPHTTTRVKQVQGVFKLEQSGIVGPKTWAGIDYLATRK